MKFSKLCLLRVWAFLMLCVSQISEVRAQQSSQLPVSISATIEVVENKKCLIVSVQNETSSVIKISTDSIKDGIWDVWLLEDSGDKSKFFLTQLTSGVQKFTSRPSRSERLKLIARRIESNFNITTVDPGQTYTVPVQLEQALNAAKLDITSKSSMINKSIIVGLQFKNLILQTPLSETDAEPLELYDTEFYTPKFVFRNSEWFPFK